ncbi:hypothetical protein V1478_004340 [Vespula squamosa]|uniref:Uncharacterized protein n=1 Tax=Vespula squamosa TaxID=30214 RepID=A0ABD2BHC1_VESSQ
MEIITRIEEIVRVEGSIIQRRMSRKNQNETKGGLTFEVIKSAGTISGFTVCRDNKIWKLGRINLQRSAKSLKRQERVASTQEVMCRIWERSVERKAASELRKMTERIRLMIDRGNQMEEIECAKKKKRKRWGYQAIRKG